MDMLKIGRPKKKKSLICTNFPTYMGLILTDLEESNRITLEKRQKKESLPEKENMTAEDFLVLSRIGKKKNGQRQQEERSKKNLP